MKYFFLFIIFLAYIGEEVYGQTVIRDVNIYSPPAPAGTSNPVVLNSGSVEYFAENEIILKANSSTDYFWAQGNTNGGSTFFLAAIVPAVNYPVLRKELDGTYFLTNGGMLYFKYEEKYTDGILKYQIYDYQRNAMIPIGTQTAANGLAPFKTVGSNFLSLNLSKASGFVGTNETNSYYILEVLNDKGDKYLLRFKYLTDTNYQY